MYINTEIDQELIDLLLELRNGYDEVIFNSFIMNYSLKLKNKRLKVGIFKNVIDVLIMESINIENHDQRMIDVTIKYLQGYDSKLSDYADELVFGNENKAIEILAELAFPVYALLAIKLLNDEDFDGGVETYRDNGKLATFFLIGQNVIDDRISED